jgi:alpha-tubulin suppressor-like RCC1 family protein
MLFDVGATIAGARRWFLTGFIALLAALLLPSQVMALTVPTSPGHLYAFGSNDSGQLGNSTNIGTPTANPTPAQVALPQGSGYVTSVAAGTFSTLVLTSLGQVYSFGANYSGQLGTTLDAETETPVPTPQLVTLPGATGPVVEVSAGEFFNLALTSTGQLYGFGDNSFGQLAQTPSPAVPNPTLITIPGVTFAQIAAGGEHSLAVSTAGTLYTFGENKQGQLGYETAEIGNPTPMPVTLPGATGPVTQVSAGDYFSLALTSTGQLYSFGGNMYGQLGTIAHLEKPNPNPPALVSLPGATGAITHISAGFYANLVSTSSGQVYAFGANQAGQLGLTENTGTQEPNPTPALVALPGASGGVKEISETNYDGYVLTGAGQLYAFGGNAYGQLGSTVNNGSLTAANPTPTPVTLPAGDAIESIGQGEESLAAFVIASEPIKSVIPPGSLPPVALLTLSHASLTDKTFRVAKGATAISAKKAPLGTSIRFTLSAVAKLQIKFTSTAPGLRHGGACVAPTHRLMAAHAKHCTRTVTDGTITRAKEAAGADHVEFSGRIGRQALKPGAHHAILSASNAGGKAKPVTLAFVIASPS